MVNEETNKPTENFQEAICNSKILPQTSKPFKNKESIFNHTTVEVKCFLILLGPGRAIAEPAPDSRSWRFADGPAARSTGGAVDQVRHGPPGRDQVAAVVTVHHNHMIMPAAYGAACQWAAGGSSSRCECNCCNRGNSGSCNRRRIDGCRPAGGRV